MVITPHQIQVLREMAEREKIKHSSGTLYVWPRYQQIDLGRDILNVTFNALRDTGCIEVLRKMDIHKGMYFSVWGITAEGRQVLRNADAKVRMASNVFELGIE